MRFERKQFYFHCQKKLGNLYCVILGILRLHEEYILLGKLILEKQLNYWGGYLKKQILISDELKDENSSKSKKTNRYIGGNNNFNNSDANSYLNNLLNLCT